MRQGGSGAYFARSFSLYRNPYPSIFPVAASSSAWVLPLAGGGAAAAAGLGLVAAFFGAFHLHAGGFGGVCVCVCVSHPPPPPLH